LVNITQESFIDNKIKALIILKPVTAFSDIEKLKLDQYVMNGGKLLFFIDRLNAEMDSLKIKNEVIAYDRELHLNDFIFHYGVRINPDLLMDLQCDYLPFDVNGNGQFEFLPWNYFPVLESSDNHPINKNLGYVSGKFVNTIDLIESEGIKKTVLLQSSPNARTIATPALISGNENVTAPQDNQYNKSAVPVAVLLEGKFTSLYTNRLTAIMQDSLHFNNKNFVNTCKEENKMLIVSDADIIMNSIVKGNQPINMGMNPFTIGTQREFPFANKEFLLNSLDYLLNVNDLSEAKSKDYTVKFLDSKKVNSQRTFWQFFNIIFPVISIIIFALIFQFLRKKKYAY
jgi:gliding-associated putative ABC transporter substrate-binding component GldG